MNTELLTDKEIKALAKRGYENPPWFCKFFLHKWFPDRMPWVHYGLIAIQTRKCSFLLTFNDEYGPKELDKIVRHFVYRSDPSDENSPEIPIFRVQKDEDGVPIDISMTLGKYTMVMMPRGFSKTTIANAVNLWFTVYQDCKFPLYLSETGPHAKRQLSNVALQISENERIRLVFGNLKPEQRAENKRWSESDGFIQTTTGISFYATGRGGQVRGQNVDAVRPDRIIVDDVEDKESVLTPEQRLKAREWFFGDVMPAIAEMNQDATITMMGTLLHRDALLTYVLEDPEWTVVVFGAIDKDGEALWKENMSLDKLENKKISLTRKSLLHLYYLEYFNQIRQPENAKFRPEFIHIAPKPLQRLPFKALAMDPAISEKPDADFCGFAVVCMCEDGIIQVADVCGERGMHPRAQIDKYFELHFRYGLTNLNPHGIESNAYQKALVHLVKEEMFRKAKEFGPTAFFEVTPVTHGNNKHERVEGVLQPRYASGYIHHQRAFPLYETQLLDWPNGKKDLPDATAQAVTLLDEVAGIVAGDMIEEDIYEPLEEIFEGEWRTY